MKNVTFDTVKAIQSLKDEWFTESQTNAIVSMTGDAFANALWRSAVFWGGLQGRILKANLQLPVEHLLRKDRFA